MGPSSSRIPQAVCQNVEYSLVSQQQTRQEKPPAACTGGRYNAGSRSSLTHARPGRCISSAEGQKQETTEFWQMSQSLRIFRYIRTGLSPKPFTQGSCRWQLTHTRANILYIHNSQHTPTHTSSCINHPTFALCVQILALRRVCVRWA